MIDSFGRTINYLRISVTDRCNLRCRYCMPSEGVKLVRHEEILSFEEIEQVARAAVQMGVNKVRLTGGEPLVRRGIVELVEKLSAIAGIEDLAMSTNGTFLAEYAEALARGGLRRVNISLDTTDAGRYRQVTRGGQIERVLAGIEAAQRAGLAPVKLNCVAGGPPAEDDARSVREFGRRKGLEVRVIRLMNLSEGLFSVVQGSTGGDCRRCNRLRLSSDGRIRPCLFSDISFGVREMGIDEAIRQAVSAKPQAGGPCTHNSMHRIGG